MLGEIGKQVSVRRTLAYGSKYGVGVFCFLKTGEQQIGWVPEKDQIILDHVVKACLLPNFQAKVDRATCKTLGDEFSKILVTDYIFTLFNLNYV